MSIVSTPPSQPSRLSAEDRALYARHAAAALARRAEPFFRARRALWIDWLVTSGIGLFGMLVLGWSAATAAVLLLIGFWLGWLTEAVVWVCRSEGLAIGSRQAGEDLRFWQIVAILRGERRQPPDVKGHPTPGFSLCVDAVAGAVATVLLWQGLQHAGVDPLSSLRSPDLLAAVALIVFAGTAPGLRARLKPGADGSVAPSPFAAGQRGIGMLVLAFALMAVGGGTLPAQLLMLCSHGLSVVMAGIELMFGVPALRREVQWVRTERAANGGDPA